MGSRYRWCSISTETPEPGGTACRDPSPAARSHPTPEASIPASLPDRLRAHLRARPDLLPRGAHILVALSGGPDSTALLLLLAELRAEFGWQLTAAHFDHGLRPDGAAQVERLKDWVGDLDVPLMVGRADRALGRAHAGLRSARYAWLRRAGRERHADRIATGHQRDDQVETVLFRILRGTGNRGLAGIPQRRGRLARPLLGFASAELTDWLEGRRVGWFDDPSNRDPRYARSRLRHGLLPALEAALGPGVADALVAIGATAGEVRRATDRVAERVLDGLERGEAAEWPAELRAEALRLAARRSGVPLRGAAARCAAELLPGLTSGQVIDLGGGLRLERVFDRWSVRRAELQGPAPEPLSIDSDAPGSGEFGSGERRRRIRWGAKPNKQSGGTRVALHVRADHFPLAVRAPSDGDRIRLPGGSRKVYRLMSEARVPRRERRSTPLVVDRDGRVLCVLRRELSHRVDRDAARNANFGIEVEDD